MHKSHTIVLEYIMVEKVNMPELSKPFPLQLLGAGIHHVLDSATNNQKEVLSEFVRGQ